MKRTAKKQRKPAPRFMMSDGTIIKGQMARMIAKLKTMPAERARQIEALIIGDAGGWPEQNDRTVTLFKTFDDLVQRHRDTDEAMSGGDKESDSHAMLAIEHRVNYRMVDEMPDLISKTDTTSFLGAHLKLLLAGSMLDAMNESERPSRERYFRDVDILLRLVVSALLVLERDWPSREWVSLTPWAYHPQADLGMPYHLKSASEREAENLLPSLDAAPQVQS